MNRDYLRWLEYTLVLALILGGFFFFSGRQRQDTDFCRGVLFHKLVSGSLGVEKFIDWENFQGLGKDMGQDYKKLPNDQERKFYRKSFIQAFSASFRASKGDERAFTNWRLDSQGGGKIVVAADYPSHKKTLLFNITKQGKERKLSGLAWRE